MPCIYSDNTLTSIDTNNETDSEFVTITVYGDSVNGNYSFVSSFLKTNRQSVYGSMGYKSSLNEKISFIERYLKITETKWFKDAYQNRIIGEPLKID